MRGFLGRVVGRLRERVIYRIFLPFCLIIIAGVSIALPYGLRTTSRVMEDRADSKVEAVVQLASNAVSRELSTLLTIGELSCSRLARAPGTAPPVEGALATLFGEFTTRTGLDVVVVFDGRGGELLRLDEGGHLPKDLGGLKIVRNGLRGLKYVGVIRAPRGMILAAVSPESGAEAERAVILVGRVVDSRFANEIKAAAGTDITISDASGVAMASSFSHLTPASPSVDLREIARLPQVVHQNVFTSFQLGSIPYRAAHHMMNIDGEPTVLLSVIMDISASRKQERKVAVVMIFLMISGVILSLVFSLLIARSISRPIEELTAATRRMAAGELDYLIQRTGTDEIGQLAESFNVMARRIRQSMDDLADAGARAQRYSLELEEINRELVKTRGQLIQAGKLVAVGQLGAGIAHELNQPLLAIGLFAEQTMKYLERDSPAWRNLDRIVGQVTRMSKIVNEIRLFARQSPMEPEELDLNAPIRSAVELVQRQLSDSNINVLLYLDDELPRVMADENQLQQVFVNLITNARDAMEPHGKGTLVIATTAPCHGEFVEINIMDTGIGIPADSLVDIFMPFVTTKHDVKGMGLGLSITHSIVERHSGIIQVESRVGHGTRFKIVFPTVRARPCWEVVDCGTCQPGMVKEACPVYIKDHGHLCWIWFQKSQQDERINVSCKRCPLWLERRTLVQMEPHVGAEKEG
jgi:C4-dicarboxylate-specific signal transduction histidine kinase